MYRPQCTNRCEENKHTNSCHIRYLLEFRYEDNTYPYGALTRISEDLGVNYNTVHTIARNFGYSARVQD